MTSFDVHQHLWPEQLVAALRRRSRPPRIDGDELILGEGTFAAGLEAHTLDARLDLLDEIGIDTAVVSLQPTLGCDGIPELVDAYHEGILELVAAAGRPPARVRSGRVPGRLRRRLRPRAHGRRRDRRAGGRARRRRADALRPPRPGAAAARSAPAWWSALVDYPAQMQAAYAAWLTPRQPGAPGRLRVSGGRRPVPARTAARPRRRSPGDGGLLRHGLLRAPCARARRARPAARAASSSGATHPVMDAHAASPPSKRPGSPRWRSARTRPALRMTPTPLEEATLAGRRLLLKRRTCTSWARSSGAAPARARALRGRRRPRRRHRLDRKPWGSDGMGREPRRTRRDRLRTGDGQPAKLALMEDGGAEIRQTGADLDEAKEEARAYASRSGLPFFEDGAEPAQYEGYGAIGGRDSRAGPGAASGDPRPARKRRAARRDRARDLPRGAEGGADRCGREGGAGDGRFLEGGQPGSERAIGDFRRRPRRSRRHSARCRGARRGRHAHGPGLGAAIAEAVGDYARAAIRAEGAAAAALAAVPDLDDLGDPLVLIVTGRNIDDELFTQALRAPRLLPGLNDAVDAVGLRGEPAELQLDERGSDLARSEAGRPGELVRPARSVARVSRGRRAQRPTPRTRRAGGSGSIPSASSTSRTAVNGAAPWRSRSFVPAERPLVISPGTANTSRPSSSAKSAVIKAPDRSRASTTTVASAEAGDDPVARWEPPGRRLDPWRILGDDCARRDDPPRQLRVAAGIVPVDPASEHRHRLPAALKAPR